MRPQEGCRSNAKTRTGLLEPKGHFPYAHYPFRNTDYSQMTLKFMFNDYIEVAVDTIHWCEVDDLKWRAFVNAVSCFICDDSMTWGS